MLLKYLQFSIIIGELAAIFAMNECCPGVDISLERTALCVDNTSVQLTCKKEEQRFMFDKDDFIDAYSMGQEDWTTEIEELNISYCSAKVGNESVFLVCLAIESETFNETKIKYGAILSYVSVIFIILTIIIYASTPQLRDLQGICIIHSISALGLAYVFLSVIQLGGWLDNVACSALCLTTYTSFLYSFFWLNTLSFHIWRLTIKSRILNIPRNWTLIYHIFAIGGTCLCLLCVLLAQYAELDIFRHIHPGITEVSCWFKSLRETFIFFYGPISVLIALNIIYYIWTLTTLWNTTETRGTKAVKYRLKLCVKLLIIMGITWIFEMVSAAVKTYEKYHVVKALIIILDILNILQGLLIFLVLVVFRKRVRRAIASKNICSIKFPNSWKFLDDEEQEEENIFDNTTVEYHTDKYRKNNLQNGDEVDDKIILRQE